MSMHVHHLPAQGKDCEQEEIIFVHMVAWRLWGLAASMYRSVCIFCDLFEQKGTEPCAVSRDYRCTFPVARGIQASHQAESIDMNC